MASKNLFEQGCTIRSNQVKEDDCTGYLLPLNPTLAIGAAPCAARDEETFAEASTDRPNMVRSFAIRESAFLNGRCPFFVRKISWQTSSSLSARSVKEKV